MSASNLKLIVISLIVVSSALAWGCGSGGGEEPTTAASEATAASQPTGAPGDAPTFSDPTNIDNPYAPLTTYERCVMEGQSDGEDERVVRTLLDRTRTFEHRGESVEVAVIEDRAYIGGELVERTLDYFAQADDGTVHYFGESVDNYENGRIANHDGSFVYGRDTDHLGVLMPGDPAPGDRWFFEKAPPITVERDTLLERVPSAEVAGETYDDVVRVRELIDGREVEFKLYAAGVGVIQELPPDGEVHLVRCA
jgi:hypothetical protein